MNTPIATDLLLSVARPLPPAPLMILRPDTVLTPPRVTQLLAAAAANEHSQQDSPGVFNRVLNNLRHPRFDTGSQEGTPSIRTVLPHLLGADSAWTTELELELLEFAESCEDYAAECQSDAVSKHRSNGVFQIISMVCSGSAAIIPHIQNVSVIASSSIVSAVGAASLVANAIQSVCSFEKSASIERGAALQLRDLSKELRLQLSRPLVLRWPDPFERMQVFEDKFNDIMRNISPKIVTNDIKDKIKAARRQRIRPRRAMS